MAANRFYTSIGRLLLVACLVGMGLMASEHHGNVKSGGLPVPGASVTATQGDKKVLTTTDENGLYSFPELADGVWTIGIDMLGFEKVSREIGVAADAPSPLWDLKMQSLEAMTAPPPPPPAPAATATTPGATATAETKPAEPAATETKAADAKPAATTTAAATNAKPPAKGNSKNSKNSTTSKPAGNNGNPSLTQALGGSTVQRPGGSQQGGFQRIGVNQSGDAAAADTGMNNDLATNSDLSQSANDAFTINGSVSQGLTMPGQGGDWGPGRGGDKGGMGPGGMMPGMGGMPGDPTQMAAGGDAGAGGGRGGRGGGAPGGGGPGGGAGFGGGGRGGGMSIPMSPGGGGRGGRGGGGRGGPGGRGGVGSFGNNRRDPRSRYNFSASGILTNSALNARDYSITGLDVSKPNKQSIRSTLTAGGPIKIPHLLTNNKGTFTINYTLGRARTGTTYSYLVPTDAEKAGNFAGVTGTNGLPLVLYNGATPIPNNQIPLASISSVATALLKYYPEPNFTGGAANRPLNYASSASGATNSDNINARLNYSFNTKNQVNGGLQYQRSNTTTPSVFAATIPGWKDLASNNGINANASYIYHFSLHVIATTRYTYSKAHQLTTPYFANLSNVEGTLGITGTDQIPLNWGPPTLNFAGSQILGLTDARASYNHPQTSAVGETVLWVRGTHQFQFGGDFSRRQANTLSQNNPRGTYSFTGAATALNGLASNGTGFDLADFLLGTPSTMALNVANSLNNSQAASLIAAGSSPPANLVAIQNTPSGGDRYLRTSVYDLFVNDQWQLSPRLSLSLGLRWDYQAPTTELYNRLATIDLPGNFMVPANIGAAAVVAGGVGPATGIHYSDSMLHGQKTDFSPRIGFAWKPFAKRSTVVRGGYGIQFSPSVYSSLVGQLDAQAPFATEFNLQNTCHATLQNGLNLTSLTQLGCVSGNQATTTQAINANFRVGYNQLWQLAVQQNLKWNMVSTVTYFASKGTALPQQLLPNSYAPGGSPICVSGFICPAGYTYETSNGNSVYDSVQAQLNRRTRGGLGWNLSYSFAKSIDDVPNGIDQNWLDPSGERGRTAGVRNQTFTGSLNYSTGVGTRGGALINGWKGVILKGWMLTTNMTVTSGAPITPTAGKLLGGGTAQANIRAYYNGQPAYLNGTLNPAAFSAPPSGQYGNIGRDALTGPGQFSINANASRSFRLADRKNLTFSLMSQNPINHPVVSSWYLNATSLNQFGLVQNYNQMRSVTATVRFNF